jgi:hypothetical protein
MRLIFALTDKLIPRWDYTSKDFTREIIFKRINEMVTPSKPPGYQENLT